MLNRKRTDTDMPAPVNLYDHAYGKYEQDAYREVRIETYGEDLGQTSWVNSEESKQIPVWLNLTPTSSVLEIGSGSGRYALRIAESVGCQVTGLDINARGIRNANQLAQSQNIERLARFEQCDVAQGLPLTNDSFDAAFSNDVLCHIPNRPKIFSELFRVLKPGARLLFSDALVVGGIISHEEIATRSSIGYYAFSPAGENEKLLTQAGFRILRVTDTSEYAAAIASRWHDAREKRKEQLVPAEGSADFEGLQRFLSCVRRLTSEKRLLRFVYLAEKEKARP
jgi:ubiquinone/menaquinone biosynthesis C-methylase UbiE